jgi:hypothetical protein
MLFPDILNVCCSDFEVVFISWLLFKLNFFFSWLGVHHDNNVVLWTPSPMNEGLLCVLNPQSLRAHVSWSEKVLSFKTQFNYHLII